MIPSYSFDSLPAAHLNNPFFNIDESQNLLKPISYDEDNVNLQQEECFDFETEKNTNDERNSIVDSSKNITINLKNIREEIKKIVDITYCINLHEAAIEDTENALELLKVTKILDRNVKKK